MLKKIKKIINKNPLIFEKKPFILFSIFALISLWIFLGIIFDNKTGFTVVNHYPSYQINHEGAILKGEKLTGEFTSDDLFLGIMYLRFKDFPRVDYEMEDILTFKIREKGKSEWYYQNNFRTGLIRSSLLFPFGFPVIFDSNRKTYQFEIESLHGNSHNSVQLSNFVPVMTGHQYSEQEVFGSKKRIVSHLFKKTYYSVANLDFLFSSLFFALPLIFYLILLTLKKINMANKYLLSVVPILFFLLDSFFLRELIFGIYVGLCLLWILTIKIFKLESYISFLYTSILSIIWLLATMFGHANLSDKLNVWVFTLMLIGVAQLFIENLFKLKNRIGIKKYLKLIKSSK